MKDTRYSRKAGVGSCLAMVFCLALASAPAAASEGISEGVLKRFAYRSGYVLFQVDANGTNACSACQADPAGYYNGGFCWVPATDSTLVSILLSAQAQKSKVLLRVTSWQQCEVYQAEIRN